MGSNDQTKVIEEWKSMSKTLRNCRFEKVLGSGNYISRPQFYVDPCVSLDLVNSLAFSENDIGMTHIQCTPAAPRGHRHSEDQARGRHTGIVKRGGP